MAPGSGPRFISTKERLLKALRLPGTATQLATRTGCGYQSVSQTLAKLVREGKVTREGYSPGYLYRLKG